MSITATQLLLGAHFGTSKSTAAQDHLFETLSAQLSGEFDPFAAAPVASTLLDLSTIDESGRSTFELLSTRYDSRLATLARLATLYRDTAGV